MSDITNKFGNGPYKLHLGCGWQYMNGWINIDYVMPKSGDADLIADSRSLPFEPNTCSEITSYHMVEHIKRPEVIDMFKHWYDLLVDGGKVSMELPNFDDIVHSYLLGNDDMVRHVFGNQDAEGQFHYWGYNFRRLKEDLESVGFTEVKNLPPTDYHVNEEPCLRVEAIKPYEKN